MEIVSESKVPLFHIADEPYSEIRNDSLSSLNADDNEWCTITCIKVKFKYFSEEKDKQVYFFA